MKKSHASIGILLAGFLAMTLNAQGKSVSQSKPTTVVGTFDSRAIAVAYANSAEYREYLVAWRTELMEGIEAAKAAGDKELQAKLESEGPKLQKKLHGQGFGTAPVDDIIEKIEGRLSDIAQKAGVDVLVSKWELDYVGPKAKFIDVTMLIAEEFEPTERTLKMMQSTMEQAPVSMEELEGE